MGGLGGGHYVAHANTQSDLPGHKPRWMCFNDDQVSQASTIVGPTAYVLFYRLRNDTIVSNTSLPPAQNTKTDINQMQSSGDTNVQTLNENTDNTAQSFCKRDCCQRKTKTR